MQNIYPLTQAKIYATLHHDGAFVLEIRTAAAWRNLNC